MAKIKTKWIDWAITTILIFNLLRQLFNFIGIAVEGHYTKHEARAIMSELDEHSRNCGNHLIDNLMLHIAREAILNLGLAIFVVVAYFYIKRKRATNP